VIQLIMKKWPPRASDTAYSGPYPVNDIQRARSKLIECLNPPYSAGLARVLPKIGIDSHFGPGLVPPPPQSIPNGLTSDSCRLPSNQTVTASPLSARKSESLVMSPPIQVSDWKPLRVSRSSSAIETRQDNADHPQRRGMLDLAADNASVAKRRYSEACVAEGIVLPPVKMLRDNGAVSRHAGQGDGSDSGDNSLPPSRIYKCDYCRVTTQSNTEMTSHLTRLRHSSASEYTTAAAAAVSGDTIKASAELQAVERILAITNPQQNNCAALVIACPDCRSIFDDIFTCGTHNKYEHGDVDGCYAVCPVIHSENVHVGDASCAVCQQRFADHNDLVEHWIGEPDHCPMPQSTDTRVFLVQTCPACSRTFNDDFLDCVIHMAAEHGSVTSVEVRHVMLPQRRERLPPFSSTGGLRDEAAVLSRLHNCFEQNAINARLEQIQKLLAGTA